MSVNGIDFSIAIGGAAGQGIATPGNIIARMFSRRGLHLYAYNAYQSIIRGGHILSDDPRIRDQEVLTHGDGIDLLLCLNQDTMDRHLGILGPGSRVLYNSDKVEPGEVPDGVVLCPMPDRRVGRGQQEQADPEHHLARRHDVGDRRRVLDATGGPGAGSSSGRALMWSKKT